MASVMAAAGLAACATATTPEVIRFPDPQNRPAPHISGIFSYSTALGSIASIFAREFRFPPFTATLFFYRDAKAVEAALLASGHNPVLAREGAARLKAIAAHQHVIVNEEKLRDAEWADRVASLTHELVHCLQYELGGGVRGTSEQWLREGFAEWVALRVLQHLRAAEPGDARRVLLEQLHASDTARAPRFDEMMTCPQWVGLAGIRGIAPQAQATLAVDALIAKHGIEAVLDYFRRFAARQDPVANFRAAFGIERAAFEQSVNATLGLRRTRRAP